MYDINFIDENGDTLLILSCKNNQKKIFEFLILENFQNYYSYSYQLINYFKKRLLNFIFYFFGLLIFVFYLYYLFHVFYSISRFLVQYMI